MRRATLALLIGAVMLGGALLAYVFTAGTSTTTKVVRTAPTLVIQTPLTPPQAKRAKRTSAAKSPDSATPHHSGAPAVHRAATSTPKSVTRPKGSTGVPAPKKHKTTSKKPTTAAQPAPSPPAQTQPLPPPVITVPLPSVCTKPIHIGSCP